MIRRSFLLTITDGGPTRFIVIDHRVGQWLPRSDIDTERGSAQDPAYRSLLPPIVIVAT